MKLNKYFEITKTSSEKLTEHPIFGKQETFFRFLLLFSRIVTSPKQEEEYVKLNISLFRNVVLDFYKHVKNGNIDDEFEISEDKLIIAFKDFLLFVFRKNFSIDHTSFINYFTLNKFFFHSEREKNKEKLFIKGVKYLLDFSKKDQLSDEKDTKEKEYCIDLFVKNFLNFFILNKDNFQNLLSLIYLFIDKEEYFFLVLNSLMKESNNKNINLTKDLILEKIRFFQKEIQDKEESCLDLDVLLPSNNSDDLLFRKNMEKIWKKEKNRIPKKDSILSIHPKSFDFKIFQKKAEELNEGNEYLINFYEENITLLSKAHINALKSSLLDYESNAKQLLKFILLNNEYVSTSFLFKKNNLRDTDLIKLFYVAFFIKLFPKTSSVFKRKKHFNEELLSYIYVSMLALFSVFESIEKEEVKEAFYIFINTLNNDFQGNEIVDFFYYFAKEEINERRLDNFISKENIDFLLKRFKQELIKAIAVLKTLHGKYQKNFPNIKKNLGKYTIEIFDKFTLKSLFAGVATNCCQVFGGAGEECLYISAVDPDATITVVEKYGYIYAQSYTWRIETFNGIRILVFDSIELPKEDVEFAEKIKDLYIELSKEIVQSGAFDLVLLSLDGGGSRFKNLWDDFEKYSKRNLFIDYPFTGYTDFKDNLVCLAGDITNILKTKKASNALNNLKKEIGILLNQSSKN